MPSNDFGVPKLSLAFAKILATPTTDSWSQVYNAGSFFTALSLTLNDEIKEDILLPAVGKKLFSSLEAEFFSLEIKSLHNIKNAIKKSIESVAPDIIVDACFAFFKDNILYIFIVGKGKVIMKRGGLLGLLLEKKETGTAIDTASGYLQLGDVIMLQTDHFTQNVPDKYIAEAFKLQLPNDIAESLSPHVHEKVDGGQAAIIITYNGASNIQKPSDEKEELNMPDVPLDKNPEESALLTSPKFQFKLKYNFRNPIPGLSRKQIISLILGLIIIIALIVGIFYTKTQQENTKSETAYNQIYPLAQKNYEEGLVLKKINYDLARDKFLKAEEILKNNIGNFKPNTKEHTGFQKLLRGIQDELKTNITAENKITPKIKTVDEDNLLTIENNNKAIAYAQDNSGIYLLDSASVTKFDKATGKKNVILENDSDWSSPVALSPYQGNIYILDQKTGILKFVPSTSGYGKSDYFKDTPPDLSKAQSIAIDGSIWIITRDGQIFKYTRGSRDSFVPSGLDKPFTNPSKIYTDINTETLYILDNGNSRIVTLSKNGRYQNQYVADILQKAKDFEIQESGQTAHVLSGGKIYELPLR